MLSGAWGVPSAASVLIPILMLPAAGMVVLYASG